jgi:hypothetical protein
MSEPIPPELPGAWRLDELVERESEDAPWQHPLGEDARGVFFCDLAGVLSVHIHAPNATDPARRVLAYFGFFTVQDVERSAESVHGEMVYELEGGYPASVLEPGAPHPFEVTGDTLLLGDQRAARSTLTRIR